MNRLGWWRTAFVGEAVSAQRSTHDTISGKVVEMRYLHIVSVAVALLLMISAGACSSGPAPAAAPTVAPAPITAPTEGIDPTSEPAVDFENDLEDFDLSNFSRPTDIDNQWFPLRPGTQYVLEGQRR
jgi:hypothetical protein